MRVAEFDFDLPDELDRAGAAGERGAHGCWSSIARPADHASDISDLPRGCAPAICWSSTTRGSFPRGSIGHRVPSGGAEFLLLERVEDGAWEALVHPGPEAEGGRAGV